MVEPLLKTIELKKYFNTPKGPLHAVDGINLTINWGETIGVVGESGCGKSTLGRVLLRLIGATGGQVLFEGEDILQYSKDQMKHLRQKMQIIFQDPYSSLNPRMTVSGIISEPMRVQKTIANDSELQDRVVDLMETVGLADRLVNAYPHELDGGRRQRIGVARALAVNPQFIVCDEPVSALDVSIQAQILNLLIKLQDERKLTYMFITHDLSVVKHISTNIMVMYLGHCVEYAEKYELFKNPLHRYTQALLSAIPIPSILPEDKLKNVIKGEVTSPITPPPGCRFAVRCPHAKKSCTGQDIPLKVVAPGHSVACTLYE